MVIAMAISLMMMTVIGALALYSGRSLAAMINYVELNQKSRAALDLITRDVRQAQRLNSYTVSGGVTTLDFVDYNGANLAFVYYATNYSNADKRGQLWYVKGGTSKVLLTDCEEFFVALSSRVPVPNTFDFQFVSTSNPAQCKMLEMQWVCARRVLGVLRNTESVQTARIVIRKQSM